ncbi:restriction endonuclease subunit S [Corynebacterium diphtheriae]|uniref:restriction endonuclease subunit S n=1 Tax=Corynebacterium diphtheriae TaxID=1717 RepID=UPI0002467DC2|nr:restriction endonuclease subunit S [Corynebacterium diphtheriae]AEX73188.1 type I restriction enzyme, S subunit [Corynebacterium diphtheriae CDCE 8392]MCM0017221.1 restriction endonuclease subunit S [Corynebacterium diphtheriae bv. mitis]MCM0026772.1 restriction endonuclease subunit S [Corynebacterium diphtheriae bv. mitis]MCM0030374.1 restriction endonuclease subunit S [Corynebacterium diphtheriae bv. mitis]MCM0037679.1 restriction endonuclease subunit S [Corynebacterium diphtheriae bv. mi
MKLGDVLPFKYGRNLPESKRTQTGEYDVVTSAGVAGSHCEALTTVPSVVVGRKGTIGKLTYCGAPVWPTDTAFFVEERDGVNLRFAYYLLSTLPFQSMNNDSAVPGLNRRDAEDLIVRIPSLQEQNSIADVLGALDDKIAANQRVQESGLDLIKALWQKAQRTSTNEVLVGDIIEVNPRTQLADTPEVAFLDMKNLPEDGHLPCTWEMKESRSGSKFLNGDTLLGRITPCFENRKLGYVDFLEEGEAGLGSTEFIVFRPKEDTPRAIPLCIASSDSFRSEAQLNMVGTSGRQRVTADFVKQFPVRWPTAEVLHDFSEATSPLLEKFSLLTKENQALARTRNELLPLLMNGKITVAEAKEAVGDVGVVKQNQQEEGDSSV